MKPRSGPPTLREKIGQMLLVGFRGREISAGDPVTRDLAERNLGGVILFDQEMADPSLAGRNIHSPRQVKALVRSLQKCARTPPFIAIDQEGGLVNRLKPVYGFPPTLSHEDLGTLNDPARTFAHAAGIAQTLARLGINLNLAPVVDLDANARNPIIKGKKRSFSSDPEIVARHALEFVRAHDARGIITCAKHFPGHGAARGDTHAGWVDTTEFWSKKELIPFQRLIQSGRCAMIMTAHVFNARLDPDLPASLSQLTLQGWLRGRLGFTGVILSDDLEMKAISARYGLAQALHLAIHAGVDVLCLGNNFKFDAHLGRRALEIIHHLVDCGKVSAARIDESFQRIATLKRNFKLV